MASGNYQKTLNRLSLLFLVVYAALLTVAFIAAHGMVTNTAYSERPWRPTMQPVVYPAPASTSFYYGLSRTDPVH